MSIFENRTRIGKGVGVSLSLCAAALMSVGANAQTGPISGDIIFVIDESGSMDPYQNAIQNGIPDLASAIQAEGVDAQFGVIGFGSNSPAPAVVQPSTSDLTTFATAIDMLNSSGLDEPGYDALELATVSSETQQRPNAGLCVVLVTDAPSNGAGLTDPADPIRALTQAGATLFGALGDTDPANSPGNTTFDSYEPIIDATGGAWFPIEDLLSDTANLVQTIGSACAEAIIADDPPVVDTLRITKKIKGKNRGKPAKAGDTITYRVLAKNEGQTTMHNVLVEDDLITPSSKTCRTLKPGKLCRLQGKLTVTDQHAMYGEVFNIATAIADGVERVFAAHSLQVEMPKSNSYTGKLRLKTSLESGSKKPRSGEYVTFRITAKNKGKGSLTDVWVESPYLTPSYQECDIVYRKDACVLTGTMLIDDYHAAARRVEITSYAGSYETGEEVSTYKLKVKKGKGGTGPVVFGPIDVQ
jgi:Mg-chelatase subunit ChlD